MISSMMSDDWVEGVHPGYRTKVIRVGNATIEINRPLLDDAERSRREETIRQALRSFKKG